MTLFIEEVDALGAIMTVIMVCGAAVIGFIIGKSKGEKKAAK